MNREKILSHLRDHPWGQQIQVYEQIDSTNTLVKELGRQGAAQGTVVIADRQTAGRGRLGRSFLSPGGVGVYLSVLLRPHVKPGEIMHLTCAVGEAMCDAVENAAGIRPGIKWANDLVIGKQKLGGILTELSLDPKTQLVDFVVIGIGINCGQEKSDFDESIRGMATSLHLATGRQVDRNRVAAEMIRQLEILNSNLLTEKEAVMSRYAKDCVTIGQDIQVVRGEERRSGKAVGLDSEGGLMVEYPDGTRVSVSSGEVSIRGMYGYT